MSKESRIDIVKGLEVEVKHHKQKRMESASRIRELELALAEARCNIEEWSNYASDYFTEKNGLAEDLAAIDKVLGGDT